MHQMISRREVLRWLLFPALSIQAAKVADARWICARKSCLCNEKRAAEAKEFLRQLQLVRISNGSKSIMRAGEFAFDGLEEGDGTPISAQDWTGLSQQQTRDALLSMSLAQTAASAAFDREDAISAWSAYYVFVLQHIGWNGRSLEESRWQPRATVTKQRDDASHATNAFSKERVDRSSLASEITSSASMKGEFRVAVKSGDCCEILMQVQAESHRDVGIQNMENGFSLNTSLILNRALFSCIRCDILSKLRCAGIRYIKSIDIDRA